MELFPHDKFEIPGKGGDISEPVKDQKRRKPGKLFMSVERFGEHLDKEACASRAREARKIAQSRLRSVG